MLRVDQDIEHNNSHPFHRQYGTLLICFQNSKTVRCRRYVPIQLEVLGSGTVQGARLVTQSFSQEFTPLFVLAQKDGSRHLPGVRKFLHCLQMSNPQNNLCIPRVAEQSDDA